MRCYQRHTSAVLALWLAVLAPNVGGAQEPPPTDDEAATASEDEDQAQDEESQAEEETRPTADSALEARVAALEAELKAREEGDLLREAEALVASSPEPVTAGAAPALNPLNPGLTAFGDMVGQMGFEDGEVSPGSTMYLRSLELEIRAAVDPYAKAAAVIAFEQEPPPLDGSEAAGEFGAGPEEAYIDLVAMPWGLSARAGKFKQPFGLMNRTHPHDLPWVDVPPALDLLAEEGYNDTGGTLSWIVPAGPLGITTTVGALSGDPFEEGVPDPYLGGLGRLAVFGGFGAVDVGVGASAVRHFGREEQALGVDFSFRYRASTRQSLVVLAEGIRSMDGTDGGYAALQFQPFRALYLGVREDIVDEELRHNFYVSYYTSEFLRVRIGGGYAPDSEQPVQILGQLTFVWGSHPAEPWWVNK